MKSNRRLLFISWIVQASLFPTLAMSQIDSDASAKTRVLYENLRIIQNNRYFLFGQEFFNSFKFGSPAAHADKAFSDCNEITGTHPAVLGSDFHYYLEKSSTERGYHTEAVKWAYLQGIAITFDWHVSARGTTSYAYSDAVKNLVNNIVNDVNGDRAWFLGEVDKVIEIINNDLVVDGERIPIVFRPFHEMNGNWFWWGSSATTPANYVLLYRLLVNYVKERTTSVLFAWSPNNPVNFTYYPGDEFVDVLGVDMYEINESTLRSNLGMIVDQAQASQKVAILSETGYRVQNDNASLYWNNTILPAIINDPTEKSLRIAWVLTWINASWSFPYVPHSGSGQTAKNKFIEFKESPHAVFADEMLNMYTPIPVTGLGVPDSASVDVQWMYSTMTSELIVSFSGFELPARLRVFDMLGKTLALQNVFRDEYSAVLSGLQPGTFILQLSDGKSLYSKRIFITQ
jgi:mannan endo-1,4-beta-mannosidase